MGRRRKGRRNVGKIYISEGHMSETTKNIIRDLHDPTLSKKEIANLNRVDVATVARIMKKYNLGTMRSAASIELPEIEEELDIGESTDIDDAGTVEKEETVVEEDEEMAEEISRVDKMYSYDKLQILEDIKAKPSYGKDRLSDDKILAIIQDLEDNFGTTETAKRNDVSISAVYRYGRKFGVVPPSSNDTTIKKKKAAAKKKSTTKKAKIEGIVEGAPNNSGKRDDIVINNLEPYKVGLIRDRHDMPECITEYIFDHEIDKKYFFDYTKLDEIVNEFILNNIKMIEDPDGNLYGERELIVYVTGLTCCVTSLIKVAALNRVNLTLMHYNARDNMYRHQLIWNSFGRTEYGVIFSRYRTTRFVKCNYEDISKMEKFYIIKVVDFTSGDKSNRDSLAYVFSDQIVMWESYSDILKDVMQDTRYKTIFAEEAYIKDNVLCFGTRLSRSCNFNSVENL